MIPRGLSRRHVLDALNRIARDGVPEERRSTSYCLEHDGRHYPPKYVISLACKGMSGFELPALQFNGGQETNEALGGLGFRVVGCKCGGVRRFTGIGAANSGPQQATGSIGTSQLLRPPLTQPQDSAALPSSGPVPVEAVYPLLYTLPRRNHLTRPAQLPENGLYVFFEAGESVSYTGRTFDRVVRVGTHNVDGRFRDRIRQHYGNVGSLSGNKNGSVFRMHVGAALMARANPKDPRIGDWLIHMRPTCPEVEEQVSQRLRECFTFVCFRVDTQGERRLLEAALIALFAQDRPGKPSENWLGKHSPRDGIRRSGLWNVQHLDGPPLTAAQFHRLEHLIRNT